MSNLRLSDVRLILTGLPALCSRYDDVPDSVYITLAGSAPKDSAKRDELIEKARTRCNAAGLRFMCFHTDPLAATPEARTWLDPDDGADFGLLSILRRYNALREHLKVNGGLSEAEIDEIALRRYGD
jgi:hypothetical protein